MRPSRPVERRFSTDSTSSSSTSPERAPDDDNDSLMLQNNDSQSSLAPSASEELDDSAAREMQERCRISPITRLPAELMIHIFQKLGPSSDLRSCMLVSKEWARNSVALLWHRPRTDNWGSLHNVVQSVRTARSYFDYSHLVKRLNLSAMGHHASDGTLQPFQTCKRIERLTLTNCSRLSDLSISKMVTGNRNLLALDVTGIHGVTDITMRAVAENCYRLQGLNITNCVQVTDIGLTEVAQNCRHVKRLKFNGCSQLTNKSIMAFAAHCRQVLEIDLHMCRQVEDDAITSLLIEMGQLRELRLAHCTRLTDNAFLNIPYDSNFESLRILDLTDCNELKDYGVQRIVQAAPRLRNLVLAKCRQLTDRAVIAITRLGKNLHYIHLGHCNRITDHGVNQLLRLCNRIRYIDLACCTNLTDASIVQLATLPKLKRIGLVKCGNITDRSIIAIAKAKQAGNSNSYSPCSLERVHLSYCTNLTLNGIHNLLSNCPRLTHLSLTGVHAFLREDLIVFCREAPPEFNDHQRELFCVFSNNGVLRLRSYLDQEAQNQAQAAWLNEQSPPDEEMDGGGQGGALLPQPPAGAAHPGPIPPPPPFHHLPGHPALNMPPFPPHAQQLPIPQVLPPLPNLHIPMQVLDDGGASGSPTNDAPLTLDEVEEEFGEGSEILGPD